MQNIKYNIKEFKNLNNTNLLFLAKSYQELYIKMYGIDSYDAYLLVTKEIIFKIKKIQKLKIMLIIMKDLWVF